MGYLLLQGTLPDIQSRFRPSQNILRHGRSPRYRQQGVNEPYTVLAPGSDLWTRTYSTASLWPIRDYVGQTFTIGSTPRHCPDTKFDSGTD